MLELVPISSNDTIWKTNSKPFRLIWAAAHRQGQLLTLTMARRSTSSSMARRMASAPPWEALTPQTKSKPHCGELCLQRGPPAKLWHIFYSIVEICTQIESNCGAALTLKNKKFKDPPPTIFTTKHIAATSVSVRKDVSDLWAPSRWLTYPVHRSTPFDNSDIKIYKGTEFTLWCKVVYPFHNGFKRPILFLTLHHHLPSQPDGFCAQSKCQLSRCDLSRAHFCNCRQTLRDEIQSPLQMKRSFKIDPVGSTVRYEMMKLCPGSV